MRFSNKQNHTNIPFSREGATYYAATLSVIVANIAVNSAWANKITDQDGFNTTTTTLAPQNPTTITNDAISSHPKFIINVLSKDLIQQLEKEFSENNRVDFKPMHIDETVIEHLSNHDEDALEEETTQDDTQIDDEGINQEIYHMLLDDDELDILIAQINAYDEKVKAIAIADEIDAKENPKIIPDEASSSSTGLILTIVGLLGAAGAGIAIASGGSDSNPSPSPSPSPPPTFTLFDEKMNEGSFKQITLAETDSYGTLTYVAAHDSDDFDITITDNIAFIKAHDDAKDEVTITASNIHNLSTTASFTIIVDNVNPIARQMKDQKMSSGEELTIDLSAKDVWSDSIIFTAATSNEDRLNVSIIDFDPSDHEAKLKMTAHDSLFPGISVTDVKVTATDDDGGSDGYSFKVAIKTPIPHYPDIPTKIQAAGTETVDTKAAETKDSTEATTKVAETTSQAAETKDSTEATTKVAETTRQAAATKDSTEATTKVAETTRQAAETKDSTEATTKVAETTRQAAETKDSTEATTKVAETTSQAAETKDSSEATTKVAETTRQAAETKDSTEATTKVAETTSQAAETKDSTEATTKVAETTRQAAETKDSTEATTKVAETTRQAAETKDSTEATTKVAETTRQAAETKDSTEATTKVAETTRQAAETKDSTEATTKVAETTRQAAETKDSTEAKAPETGDSKDTTTTVVTTKSSAELDDIVVTESDLQEESTKTQTGRQASTSTDSKSDSVEKQTTTDIDSDEADLF